MILSTLLAAALLFVLAFVALGAGLLLKRSGLRGSCEHARRAVVAPDGSAIRCPRCRAELDKPGACPAATPQETAGAAR